MLERHGRLVREGDHERLLLRREMVHVGAEHGQRADRLVAHDERRGQHGAERARLRHLRVADARIVLQVGALLRPALLHGHARDALADPEPDPAHDLRVEVEARRRRELARGRVEREETAGLDTEHLARLLEDETDRLADVQALVDGVPRFEERLALAAAALALLEETRVLDRDARLVREALEERLVPAAEEADPRREGRDDADQLAAHSHRHGEHGADAFLLVDLALRRARVGADVVHAQRHPRHRGAPDDPLAQRHGEPAPRGRPEAVGGHVHHVGALRVEETDAAAGAADEVRHGAADGLEERAQVEPRGDELAGPVERGQRLGALRGLRVQARVLDGGGERPRHLAQRFEVRVGERAGRAMPDVERADDHALRDERRQHGRAEPATRQKLAACRGHGGIVEVVHAARRLLLEHPLGERALEWNPDRPGLRSPGLGRHGHQLELAALGVHQRDREHIEAHQPSERPRHGFVDLLERVRVRVQLGDLVDHDQPERAPVEAPDLLERQPELERERGRDRAGSERPPQEHERAQRMRRRTKRRPQQERPARPLPPRRRLAQRLDAHLPRRRGVALAKPAGQRRTGTRAGEEVQRRARPAGIGQAARGGARQLDEALDSAPDADLGRGGAAETGQEIRKEAADLHRDPILPRRGPEHATGKIAGMLAASHDRAAVDDHVLDARGVAVRIFIRGEIRRRDRPRKRPRPPWRRA